MNRIQTLPRSTAATRYRQREQLTGGVVVLHHGIATGWMAELRNPHEWQQGVVAVDETGNEWIALGGDINGASEWRALN